METTMNLPKNMKTFRIDVRGETTGKQWVGEFVTVCMPTLRQKANAAVMESQLNTDLQNLDSATMMYHQMISQLAYRLESAPDWWIDSNNGQDLHDFNVVYEVFKNCAEAEREWREKIWGKDEEKDTIKRTDDSSSEGKTSEINTP